MFDHKLVVAEDDPWIEEFQALDKAKLADVTLLPSTGCEAFAEIVAIETSKWLDFEGLAPRVRLVSVECFEHAANSALWTRESVC